MDDKDRQFDPRAEAEAFGNWDPENASDDERFAVGMMQSVARYEKERIAELREQLAAEAAEREAETRRIVREEIAAHDAEQGKALRDWKPTSLKADLAEGADR